MTNGIFKSSGSYGHTRAINIMSTQSLVDFEWSVKLVGGPEFDVGVASQLKRDSSETMIIGDNDENSILYRSEPHTDEELPDICIGSNVIHTVATRHKIGDIIRFRFQPHAKKLLIDLVRI